jgi:hypothetical protein
LFALFAAALVVAGAGCSASHGVVVERADVRLNMLLDGSLEVRETLTLGTTPAVTAFDVQIPRDRVDDFIDISGWIGDRRLPEGAGAGHVRVTQGNSLRVRWQFASPADRAQMLTLQFRATGVLALEGTRGVLQWMARPVGLGQPLGPTHIELTAPSQAIFVVALSVVEPGWTISALADRWTAEKAAIGPDETVTVAAVVAADSLALAQPAWQYRAARARELRPAFIACGPFLFVVGFGVLGLLRLQYPPARADRGEEKGIVNLAKSPGLGSAVARDGRPSPRRTMAATLTGLIERGAIEIAGESARGAAGRVVTVHQTAGLLQHEQLVADELWLGARDGRLEWSAAVRALGRIRPARLRRAVVADLVTLGLVDRDRDVAARGLRHTGMVVMGLGVVLTVLLTVGIDAFGVWLLVIPASFVGVGALFVAAAARFSIFTEAGERAGLFWRSRRAELAIRERSLDQAAN